MPVIMFGGEKGGSGKSTLATNVAVYLVAHGRDTLLLDTDPQATAAKWIERRNERIETEKTLPIVHCIQRTGNVRKTVEDLIQRYEYVIIDAGGHDNQALRTAMTIADNLLIPIRASQADLETLPHVAELVRAAKDFNSELTASVVISMGPTNPVINETSDAKTFLTEFQDDFSLCNTVIRDRKVYRDALLEGVGVWEMRNDKAKLEIKNFVEEIAIYEQV